MLKVMIVDDEYIMRQGLKYMINWEQEGYEIIAEAANGKDALEILEKERPDIMISDIVMPVLNGVDFTDAVHKMYPEIQIIILSGYDKFEYVKHTLMNGVVDYILKPTLSPVELIKVLEKAAQGIPGYEKKNSSSLVNYNHLLERYLLGHEKELDTAEFAAIFPEPNYCVYAMNIKKEDARGQDLSTVLFQKIQREVKQQEELITRLLYIREEIVCIFFNYRMSQTKKVRVFIEGLQEGLEILCSQIFGVVSTEFYQLPEAREIYQKEILTNIDQAFYYEDQKILFLTEEAVHQAPVEPIKKFGFVQYNQMLGNKQYLEALEQLQQYNGEAIAGKMEEYRLKNQIKNLIYNFLDFLPIAEEEKENKRYFFFQKLEGTSTATDYMIQCETIWAELAELSGQESSFVDGRMKQMLHYIEENYREDLKLESLAAEFSFNYFYLSAYFNKQMKEGFSDYLNRIRVKKACQLLREEKLSIAQVSDAVGYSEHSYFCRVFKKITGETPSSWRRGTSNEAN